MNDAAPIGAAPVASPCTLVCRMDAATGWCAGCHRTLEEITAWPRLDDEGRRRVWLALAQRRECSREAGPAPR